MRIILVGCGRVGSGLAYRLQADGHQITVIDEDSRAVERLGPGYLGDMLVGSALDQAVLRQAGITGADALAAVTGSDEINAVVARLAAQRFRVPRVVARMYDPGEAGLYSRLGVLTISPVEWGISRLAHLLTLRDAAHTVTLGAGRIHLLEVVVPAGWDGRRAVDLEVLGETRVISVTRAGQTMLADAITRLQIGDVLAIAVMAGSEAHLEQMLE